MKHSTGQASKAQQRRFLAFQQIGCIVCREFYGAYRPADVSHLLSGGTRMGHDATIPECEYHHRGVIPQRIRDDFSSSARDAACGMLGPNRADHGSAYSATYGGDEALLAVTNERITELGLG